jgi:hypothetical protein
MVKRSPGGRHSSPVEIIFYYAYVRDRPDSIDSLATGAVGLAFIRQSTDIARSHGRRRGCLSLTGACMRKPLLTGVRRVSASVSIATALAALTAGSAIAAGSGYGPTSPTNSVPPSGFSAVMTVKTFGNNGGVVSSGGIGGLAVVKVPRGAAGKSLLVAITHGSDSTIRADSSGALRDDNVLGAFGIELRHGSSAATARRPLTVIFEARDLRRGDVVVAYNPKIGQFVPVAARFSFAAGQVVARFKSSQSIAILGPKT